MLMWEWAAHFAMVVALVCAVYYIALECSPLQGTLGKHVLGIQVTDLNGRRLTFSRALSRFLLRFASALPLYLGFVMAAVGTRKQALHDVIVGTLVVRREPTESLPAVPGHFWRRVAASLIDGFLVMMVLVYPLRAVSPAGNQATVRAISGFVHNQLSDAEYDALVRTAQVTSALSLGILFAGFGLYFVLLEISPLEATLGKRWLGIRVADLDGRRLTLGRATARYVSRWLAAGIWQVGFLMAAFTPRSQGLHDILAGTAVFRR
jgi:uncharacterized RDD family membrane protein YckC